ncbi:casein kinase substrate phosphoprotein pp28 [Ophiostoma piceae UAMH 11346]|uniref:Casein kinase substrate phosphoprotein pp28 n=1 Tax=Ophiostoma piceae (strain UAMH 11346) TaxID=1262450 RepID=S3C0P7_OPHP1|nr:casein kinase substrate phosphoprotein pp28 [Ophiostoma piceae UAMH 11346]
MVGGAPGANSRGRGGKFRKFTRGGGKHFSRDLRPVDADGNEISMWAEGAKGSGSEEEEEEEESEEESEEEDAAPAPTGLPGVESREDRKKEKKARKEAAIARARGQAVQVGDMPESEDESEEDDVPVNPNHSAAGRNQTRLGQSGGAGRGGVNAADAKLKGLSLGNDESSDEAGPDADANNAPQSRRERESLEAMQAKDRYRKLHEQGKTDEAKADLARLKIIREKREAEAARKQAEREERDAQEKVRRDEIEAREAKKREAALGKSSKKGKK